MTGLGATAELIRSGALTATAHIEATLSAIASGNGALNAFTQVFADQALAEARAIDTRLRQGAAVGPLAGVAFAVKDLFDLKGHTTTAGAKMRVGAPPANADAEAVRRLKAAGAICVGTLNMDEYAYGFATVNSHFGTTRNPYDYGRLAGGSSGGSAASVAADMVPLSLGSDTNGSVRVPASLCGVWGYRPSEGVIPTDGVFPFVERFDRVGPFTRSAADLALSYAVLAEQAAPKPLTHRLDLRIARLGGFFDRNGSDDAVSALDQLCEGLGKVATFEIEGADAARSAAFLITAAEGGVLHLETLRTQAMGYDPLVRDRLLAGALMPSGLYQSALKYLETFRIEVSELFEEYDVLLTPATPLVAPRIEDTTMMVDGAPGSVRANLGLYAQAITLAGLPVVSAPVKRPGFLPMGVQMIGRWGADAELLQLAQSLESEGLLGYSAPVMADAEAG